MPRQGYYAYITPIERPGYGGGPVDPDWGVDEGGHPDQGLPGGRPPHVGNRPPGSGDWRPGGGWGGEHPGNRPPGSRPVRPGQGLPRPGRPVDPGYGIEEEGGGEAGQLPVWPVDPTHPIAPPIPGEPNPPVDPPPGTVWPPLPPGTVTGKALALVWIQGVGYRYVVIQISPPAPDQGLPPGTGEPTEPPTPQPKGLRR